MRYLIQHHRALALKKQKGFSLVAAFIVIAILMAVIAYFVAGQGMNTSTTGTFSNSARASSIISQGGYLQGGVNVMIVGGTTTADALTFDTATTSGLFNPTTGGAQVQVPDASSMAINTAGNGFWAYRGAHLKVPGVGKGGDSYAVVLSGLKQAVCEQINTQLHGAQPGVNAGVAAADFFGTAVAATPSDTTTATVTLPGAYSGWDKGCAPTNDNNYVYYQVLIPV